MNDTKNMTSHILSGRPAVILPRKGWSEGGCSSWRWRQRHKDDRTAQLACTKSKRLVRKWNRNGKMSRSRILWGVCVAQCICVSITLCTLAFQRPDTTLSVCSDVLSLPFNVVAVFHEAGCMPVTTTRHLSSGWQIIWNPETIIGVLEWFSIIDF